MALPQRDDLIEEIKRTDALLEYAVMHGGDVEAERLAGETAVACVDGRCVRMQADMGQVGGEMTIRTWLSRQSED